MEEVECPRKFERRNGVLESFNAKPGQSCAYVRTGDDLFHVTLVSRGVLQHDGNTIVQCAPDERRQLIEPGTPVVIDVVFDFAEKNPVPGLWAPKAPCKRGRL